MFVQALGGGGWGLANITRLLAGSGHEDEGGAGYSPHAVAGVKKGAAAEGILKVGDEVSAVNGEAIVDMHPQAVQELFARCDPESILSCWLPNCERGRGREMFP
jgi:hypothetical protein